MSQIRIAGACLNQTPIDWNNNISNIRNAITEARKENVKILCLPELCITAYGCQDLFLSEWLIEEAIKQLLSIVPICEDIAVAVGLPIRHKGQIYNSTCLIQNGEILGFYAKQILANDGIHYEHRWFSPWPSKLVESITIKGSTYPIGDLTFQIEGTHVGFEICEDAWNEVRPACRLYEKGVELILNPSASHFAFGKHKIREKLIVSSSEKFECHYLYVNQLGNESGRVIYDGDIILASHGQLLTTNKRLSFSLYQLLPFDIDIKKKRYSQSDHVDDLDNNRDFAKAASLGLFDYLRKSKAKGYTLSLSGGADSSSIAVLVAELVRNGVQELGVEKFLEALQLSASLSDGLEEIEVIKEIVNKILITAYQGTRNSSDDTLNSAKALATSIGAQFKHWEVDDVVSTNHEIIEKAIGRKLTWEQDDIAMQNIQARSRSPLIWMIANITGTILLTTSNRSEGDVGYTTMDGDTSGSLAPIAGVDKPFLLQWLKYAEKELGYSGLSYVNSLTPTAELRPKEFTQTDEDDLMPYPILVQIERLGIFQRKSPLEVYQHLNQELKIDSELLKSYIRKFYRLWSINQWKRERLAPSFHLDDFNVDPKTWCRFPILSGSFVEELKALDQA
ncbi:NAD+ synthase (glutamine-hydrolysing) [Reichenbachiella faecimaris]|uniref:Glutamine-dependent NAD(+) synthetase n=1 Tax=Reichenbachiella faecimaris TaxID=692418 RepID=A0A1W2GLE5_REIFA|nr:NAD(+) synthase [Reichenbachiella faecimaris]SMD37312.1 NAD+ synthase (glutamine-hydrolysing) [Reichenbachiella faecimaris]